MSSQVSTARTGDWPEARALVGAPAFRDLGGSYSKDGRPVQRGLVFRSCSLVESTEQDVEILRTEIGLRTVVDLRDRREVALDGDGPVSALGLDYRRVPLVDLLSVGPPPRTEDTGPSPLIARYAQLIRHGAPAIVEVFEMIAEPTSQPLMFHCTAGKDRTGIVAALLLDAIGVSLQAIGNDYSIMDSQVEWLRAFLGRRAVQGSRVASMDSRLLRCNRETIEEVLLGVNREYGSTRLLLLAAGASPDLFDRLEAALLVAQPCPTTELAT